MGQTIPGNEDIHVPGCNLHARADHSNRICHCRNIDCHLELPDKRNAEVARALDSLIDTNAASARHTIGRVARKEAGALTRDEFTNFADAAFQIMWAIQHSDFARSTIGSTALAVNEAKWLYRQLEVIVPDLQTAIDRHGKMLTGSPC